MPEAEETGRLGQKVAPRGAAERVGQGASAQMRKGPGTATEREQQRTGAGSRGGVGCSFRDRRVTAWRGRVKGRGLISTLTSTGQVAEPSGLPGIT